jgi:DNA modification methylase
MRVNCTFNEMRDVVNLVEHPRNYNKHSRRQIEMLAKIMNFQGWRHPIIVSKRSGFIVAGHGRLMAAKLLGWDKCPIDLQEFADEATELSFLVADNKIAELAETDAELLSDISVTLGEDFDHELLGLEESILVIDEDKVAIEDDVPEPTQSISKLGDIYELGEHRLLCGDSTDKATVERLMNGEKADMVFTDPPYNHASDEKLVSQSVSQAMKKLANSEWDKNFDFSKTFQIIDNFRAENCSVYICTSWHLAGSIWNWMKESHSNCSGYCVWHKTNPMPSLMKRHWTWASELICYATWGKHTFNFPAEGHASSVWSIQKNQKNDLHPTMKPVEIPERAILHSSDSKNNILDLFGGSGSTLIACEKTKRKCFMMELDHHYVDVIVTRWCKYTGKTEIKRNGETLNWTI